VNNRIKHVLLKKKIKAIFLILQVLFPCVIMCLVGSCQRRLNSALESCGTGVLTGVIVLAVYVSQIND